MPTPSVIILMGVSGSGKTTIGKRLAADIGWNFHDADDDHSPQSIEQMSRGRPLTNEQREPWLRMLAARIRNWRDEGTPTILACSALTERSRELLTQGVEKDQVAFVYLRGPQELIAERTRERNHFMPQSLLDSQYETLEEPRDAIKIDAAEEPSSIVKRIREALRL